MSIDEIVKRRNELNKQLKELEKEENFLASIEKSKCPVCGRSLHAIECNIGGDECLMKIKVSCDTCKLVNFESDAVSAYIKNYKDIARKKILSMLTPYIKR